MPNITILSYRDPDSYTETRMFVDGIEFSDYNVVDFDPGAGHSLSDIRSNAHDALKEPGVTDELRDALITGFEMERTSSYTSDDSEPCIQCGADVTEYREYSPHGRSFVVGHLDGEFSMSCGDGRNHTIAPTERDDDDTDKEEDDL